jgi:hypothetical protein
LVDHWLPLQPFLSVLFPPPDFASGGGLAWSLWLTFWFFHPAVFYFRITREAVFNVAKRINILITEAGRVHVPPERFDIDQAVS